MSLVSQNSIDEFEKCEVCYEEFDDIFEYGRKPYCLFPCGKFIVYIIFIFIEIIK